MFRGDLFDVYQKRISSKLVELGKIELDILELYEGQWIEVNQMMEKGILQDCNYDANAYGLKVNDSLFVFQLDGLLPFLSSHEPYYIKDSRKHHSASRSFIVRRLKNICSKFNVSFIQPPVGIAIIYYGGRKSYDVDNKHKRMIINSVKGSLFKDDTREILSTNIEKYIPSEHEKTLIFVGAADIIESELNTLVKRHNDIKTYPDVIVGDIPFVTKKEFNPPKVEATNEPIFNRNESFF